MQCLESPLAVLDGARFTVLRISHTLHDAFSHPSLFSNHLISRPHIDQLLASPLLVDQPYSFHTELYPVCVKECKREREIANKWRGSLPFRSIEYFLHLAAKIADELLVFSIQNSRAQEILRIIERALHNRSIDRLLGPEKRIFKHNRVIGFTESVVRFNLHIVFLELKESS